MNSNPTNNAEGSSHGQILKSSALIGGSQVLVILVGIVRTKILAVLLGPPACLRQIDYDLRCEVYFACGIPNGAPSDATTRRNRFVRHCSAGAIWTLDVVE